MILETIGVIQIVGGILFQFGIGIAAIVYIKNNLKK